MEVSLDDRYAAFAVADPVFYDRPGRGEHRPFTALRRPTPAGWLRQDTDEWVHFAPENVTLPAQGWKVHASATQANCDEIATRVIDYCLSARVAFKVVPGPLHYRLTISKYADRSASGKLATIYPQDEAELERVLHELGEILDGQPSPYVLSDLRWRRGPLYVRYGAFLRRPFVDEHGLVREGIEDPDGRLVPDPREPVFSPPPWVRIPDFLRPALRARESAALSAFGYSIVRAIHFSNGGGVYEGRDKKTGAKVLLKEARPFAGVDAAGRDAVARLRNERRILEWLDGLPCVPRLLDYQTVDEHEFLVQEFIEGHPLNSLFALNDPLIRSSVDTDMLLEKREWAIRTWQQVADAVARIHERGVIFGDLHPFNVIVRKDQSVALVDYEISWLREEGGRPTLANPAFAAPRRYKGFDVDRYALQALKVALFVPLTTLVGLQPAKVYQLVGRICEVYKVPADYFATPVTTLASPAPAPELKARTWPSILGTKQEWPELRESLVRSLLSSATPDREDRLFPGDVAQFGPGGHVCMATGAAGVLWVLDRCGDTRFPEGEKWLIQQAMRAATDIHHARARGFFNGIHGAAYALEQLGHVDEALALMEKAEAQGLDGLDAGLYAGLSGIGLNLFHFGRHDPRHRDAALEVSRVVRARLGGVEDVPTTSTRKGPRAGLLQGASGPALLFIRAFEETGERCWLDAAAVAIRQDLRRCVRDPAGGLHVNEGWRSMPYLGSGSAGVGLALRAFRVHRQEEEFELAYRSILKACATRFCAFSGLFNGRAGMLLLTALATEEGHPLDDAVVREQMESLNWHILSYSGAVAFPGDQLMRISMDLATGTAGVFLAAAVANNRPIPMPFFGLQEGTS
ncbi:Serine/threonine protein kinase [Thermostaphylospora chromogena]|uniref:Serine/threonine protein kinase n=2 Tax=Thermostaphylospora chromogena TaxID=35622 RepID=A0A1H1H8J6_9ACTN|nr:class III lanthionine synthetase LanKC [Thermostaphylospora chromogena]SDR21740.1 Serine/threonine protein kinase [Thermostaphylospora chromogena]